MPVGNRKPSKLAVGAVLALAARVAAADSLAFSVGAGDEADLAGVSLQFDRREPLREYAASKLTGHLELAVGYARGNERSEQNDSFAALGVTPVVRWQGSVGEMEPFLEGGIGFRLLSDTRIYESRAFSTAFQFGELIGAGLRFGARRACEFGVRIEHMSNGGIKKPNDGIDFAVIRFAYHYD